MGLDAEKNDTLFDSTLLDTILSHKDTYIRCSLEVYHPTFVGELLEGAIDFLERLLGCRQLNRRQPDTRVLIRVKSVGLSTVFVQDVKPLYVHSSEFVQKRQL